MAMDDAEIIRRVTAGEVDLFETLVNRYRVHVARIVSRHVPRDRVDELCQDAFIRAYRSLGTVKKGVGSKAGSPLSPRGAATITGAGCTETARFLRVR